MPKPLAIIAPTAAALVAVSLLTARAVPAADPDPLERRVAEIERVLLRDPNRPETAVIDRLARVEKTVALTGSPSDLKTPEDLKKAVTRLNATQDELDRRLKAIESDRHQGPPPEAERALRDLRSDVQENAKAIKDVDQRLHKLESKR